MFVCSFVLLFVYLFVCLFVSFFKSADFPQNDLSGPSAAHQSKCNRANENVLIFKKRSVQLRRLLK